jgi:hypothetical protein
MHELKEVTKISNIVFTKNRPLQLDAYLKSLYRFFPEDLYRTYILYKVELFEKEYELLFNRFPDCIVIKEKDFHSDFLEIISQVKTKYILFGIDDVVFYDSVEFSLIDETFNKHADDIFGFTLRFSPESLKNSNDVITNVQVAGQNVYRLDWRNGQTSHTQYPFELCATIYLSEFVERIINGTMNNNSLIRMLFSPDSFFTKKLGKVISTRSFLKSFGYFFSPNTLESWNCRWCQNHSDQLPGSLYFKKLCASAIQVNMVNTSTLNTFDGDDEYTVEALNNKYKEGYSMDIDFVISNKPTALAGGKEYFRLIKK